MIKAKFKCTSITITKSYDGLVYDYKFSAVTSGSKENETFWKWTPSGSISLSSIRSDLFEIDKEYYVDFALFVPLPPIVEEMKE